MRMKRRHLKEKDGKRLLSQFFKRVNLKPDQIPTLKPPIEILSNKGEEIALVKGKPIFAKLDELIFPTLLSEELLKIMPQVIVNMGAVPYICRGADVMAPGIVDFKGFFNKSDEVVVVDEHYRKPIAITLAVHNVTEAKLLKHGKILENIHYVGDNLWKTLVSIN